MGNCNICYLKWEEIKTWRTPHGVHAFTSVLTLNVKKAKGGGGAPDRVLHFSGGHGEQGVGEDGVMTLKFVPTSPQLSFFLPDVVTLGPGLPLWALEAGLTPQQETVTIYVMLEFLRAWGDRLCLHPLQEKWGWQWMQLCCLMVKTAHLFCNWNLPYEWCWTEGEVCGRLPVPQAIWFSTHWPKLGKFVYLSGYLSMFVSCDCCDKLSQSGGLKQQKCILSHCWRLEVQNRDWELSSLRRLWGKNPFHDVPPPSGSCQQLLDLEPHDSNLCSLCGSNLPLPYFNDTCHWM